MKLRKDEALDPHVVQELAELEEALGPELRRLRSEPRPEFAAELDARAAAQFGGGGSAGDRVAGTWERFRAAPLRRQLMPVAAGGLAAIVVATAIVSSVGEEQGGGSNDSGAPQPTAIAGGASEQAAPPPA